MPCRNDLYYRLKTIPDDDLRTLARRWEWCATRYPALKSSRYETLAIAARLILLQRDDENVTNVTTPSTDIPVL